MLAMVVNDDEGYLDARVIVIDHREHARSYSKSGQPREMRQPDNPYFDLLNRESLLY